MASRRSPRLLPLLTLAGLASLSLACAVEDTPADESGETGDDADEGTDTDTDEGADDGGECSLECTATPASHERFPGCPGPDCAVAVDVQIECGGCGGFTTSGGISVAGRDGQATLVELWTEGVLMLEVEGEAVERVDVVPVFSATDITQDSTGAVHLVTHDGYDATYAYPDGEGYATELAIVDKDIREIFGIELDLEDRPHIYYEFHAGPNSDPQHETVRTGPGEWTSSSVTVDNTWSHHDFGLDRSGELVRYYQSHIETEGHLMAEVAGQEVDLGMVAADYGDVTFLPLPLPKPAPAEGGALVTVVARQGDGLHLRGLAGDGVSTFDVAIPDSAAPVRDCPEHHYVAPGESCSEACHEQSAGLEYEAFDVAETSDGRVWVAWVETHYDRQYTYTLDCSENGLPDCDCYPSINSDESTARIHLAEVDVETGTVGEAMTIDADAIMPMETVQFWPGDRSFDLSAFGTTLTLGTREQTEGFESDTLHARLIHLDTAKL